MCSAKAFFLKCGVQNYAWGKLGKSSEVAKLKSCSDKDFKIDEKSPYAEYWMGTHSKGPSSIFTSGELLSKWIEAHPESLGSKVPSLFPELPGQLPYLFKVLSVNKALSIQVHPNKEEAKRLHKENPAEYPDDNHKPEMAIAMTPFEALCGFRPVAEIKEFLKVIPELRSVIGEANATQLSVDKPAASLKICFTALMSSNENLMKEQLSKLVSRVKQAKTSGNSETMKQCLGELLLRLSDEYPGDVGCFAIYFLNYFTLKKGEAIFLEANLPHAYLYGDCLECMACSDNVVRAGLTPKFKDVNTLCSMLNYGSRSVKEVLFAGKKSSSDPHVTIFKPPVKDFSVHQIQLPKDVHQCTIQPIDGASILIVIEGTAEAATSDGATLSLKRGSVVFISANETLKLNVKSSNEQILMYRACCDGSD